MPVASQSVRSPAKYEKKPVKNSAAPSANPLTAATAWFRVNADAEAADRHVQAADHQDAQRRGEHRAQPEHRRFTHIKRTTTEQISNGTQRIM